MRYARGMAWFVYIVECNDGSLYTGITTDVERRVSEHNAGVGAKYTRVRTPVRLVYEEEASDRSSASKREWAIKQCPRATKLRMATAWEGRFAGGCAEDR